MVIRAVIQPNVSIATVALHYRLNANLLRSWLAAQEERDAAEATREELNVSSPEFVPRQMQNGVAGTMHIEIEVRARRRSRCAGRCRPRATAQRGCRGVLENARPRSWALIRSAQLNGHDPLDYLKIPWTRNAGSSTRRSVAEIARSHEVNANQLFDWRKQYLDGRLGVNGREYALLPVTVNEASDGGVAEPAASPPAASAPGQDTHPVATR